MLTVREKILPTAYENSTYCVQKFYILRQKILPDKQIKSFYVFKNILNAREIKSYPKISRK